MSESEPAPDAADPDAVDPEATNPEATNPDAATQEADEPEVFANRAARRAKGKSVTRTDLPGTTQRIVGRNSVQSPRQYGTRRSG
jgi:hypothetical protein